MQMDSCCMSMHRHVYEGKRRARGSRGRLILEQELCGLAEVRQSLVWRVALAGELDFKCARYVELAVSGDDSREPNHVSSVHRLSGHSGLHFGLELMSPVWRM